MSINDSLRKQRDSIQEMLEKQDTVKDITQETLRQLILETEEYIINLKIDLPDNLEETFVSIKHAEGEIYAYRNLLQIMKGLSHREVLLQTKHGVL